MDLQSLSTFRRYAIAVVATATGVLLRELLGATILPSAYLTAYAAVLFSAWQGGFGPGMLATALSAVIDWYLFLPAIISASGFDSTTATRIVLFSTTATVMCWFVHRSRTAEARLSDREARLRRMFDTDLVGITFYHRDGALREANHRFLEMIGYTPEDVLAGRVRWPELTPPEFAQRDATALEQLAATGSWTPFEKEYVRKDGSRIPVIITGGATNAERDEGVAFVFDITERKQAEQALRTANAELERRVRERTEELQNTNAQLQAELATRRRTELALRQSEERYRQISQLTSDFAYSLRVNRSGASTFEWSVGPFERVTGYTIEELGVSGLLSLVHPDDMEPLTDRVRQLLSGTPTVTEYRLLTRRGEVRWVRDYGRPVWDDKEQRIVQIIGAAQDITASKHAEATLRESEERFQSAFRETANGMALVGINGVPFQVNRALCNILGYSEEEFLTVTAETLTHPDDLPAEREYARRLLAGEIHSCQFEKRYRHKRGHVVWASLSVSLLRSPDGRPLHYISQVEDITERRRLYEQLRESEERFSNGFKYAPIGMGLVGIDGVVIQVNRALCDMLGYTESELLAKRSWELGHPDDMGDLIDQMYKMVIGETDTWHLERRFIHKDGHLVWGESSTSMVRDEKGNPLYVISQVQDVTARKQAEEALRASEARFLNAFRYASVGMALVGTEGRPLQINAALCRMLGYTEAELLPKAVDEVMHPDDIAAAHADRQRLLDGLCESYEAERRYLHKSGAIVWTQTSVSLVRGGDGGPLHTISQLHDITERKRVEAALRASEERYRGVVEDQTEVISRFAADGTLTFVNDVFCRFFGKTSGALLGTRWQPAAVAEDLPLIEEHLQRLSPSNPVAVVENRVRSGTGNMRWMQFVNRGFFDADGQLTETQSVGRDVTESKRAEAALRESETRFANAFMYAPIGIALVGLDGRPFQVNPALCDMLGYSEAELLAKAMFELLHPDDRAVAVEDRGRLVAGEANSYHSERRYFHKSGRVIFTELSGSLVRRHDGEFAHYILQLKDITDRKESDLKLRQSEERFALAVEGSNEGVWDWWLESNDIYLSPRWKAILGFTDEEIGNTLGNWIGRLHPEDQERSAAIVSESLTGPVQAREVEYRLRHKDGNYRWVSVRGLPVLDAAGKVYRMVGSMSDITERKAAESALRSREAQFENAFRDAPTGIALVGFDTRLLRVNHALCAMLGYSPAELLGRPLADIIHPEERVEALQAYEFLSAGERERYQTERRYIGKSRRVAWAQVGMSLVRDHNDRPQYVILHALDITVRRSFSEILRALNAGTTVSEMFQPVAEALRGLTGCTGSILHQFDDQREWMTILAIDSPPIRVTPGVRLRLADSPAAPDILAGQPHIVPDVTAELEDSPIPSELLRAGFRSTLSLPLRGADQRIIGMMGLGWPTVGACLNAPLPTLRQISDAVALTMERHLLFEQVRSGHEQLQTLSRELLRVQEAERRHLATELHDEIGQTLTGVKLLLETIDRLPPTEAGARLAHAQTLINDLVTQVRNLSLDLRPAMLDDLGLLPALLWLFERYSSQTGVQVAFEHHGLERRLPAEIENAAFRIVQEALTNVARHAAVGEAHVGAYVDDTGLALFVTDDGDGFDPGAKRTAGSTVGIAGMRERASLLRGQLSIQSAPGAGTTVRAQLPLNHDLGRTDERNDLRG